MKPGLKMLDSKRIAERSNGDGPSAVLVIPDRRASARIESASEAGVAAARDSGRRAKDRLQRLAAVALDLLSAETVEDVTETVVERGLPVLGADGGAVVIKDSHGVLRVTSSRLGEEVRLAYSEVRPDGPFPAAHVIRCGEKLVLPDRAAAVAFAAEMGPALDLMERAAMVTTPLKLGDRVFGALSAMWIEERIFAPDELLLIEAFAALCAQALARIELAEFQRAATFKIRQLAEDLQRSLLTRPTPPASLEIAVRYYPAAEDAKIGGDWYDAFVTASGTTILVIGDVTGHDGLAAAAMGQLRNLLRGMAYDTDDGPAVLLSRLDRAMAGLEVDVIASAIVAIVEPSRIDHRPGHIRLRWSNAGHPAPMLRYPDGLVRILDGTNDLLLGVEPTAHRIEQVIEFAEGSTLLLYTDGLVERRGTDLDDQIQRVARLMRDVKGLSAEALCDTLSDAVGTAESEDDVALLAVHCGPPALPHPRTLRSAHVEPRVPVD